MKKLLIGPVAAAMMTCGLGGTSWATVYSVDDTVGPSSITGTIQTNGNLGALSAADITTWDLVLNDGSNTFHLSPSANGAAVVSNVGGDLTATADGLFFDFGASTGDFLEFVNPAAGPARNYLCLQDTNPQCSNGTSADFIVRVSPDSEQTAAETGTVEFAVAVPEPSSIALFVAGLVALGFLRRRAAG